MAACKAVLLLALCAVLVCETVTAASQHTCAYPQTCTEPGEPDPSHIVNATAKYDPTTMKCEEITPEINQPHDCQKFPTIEECKENCETASG
ncbi:unnamed protein product [Ixodes pacificus]